MPGAEVLSTLNGHEWTRINSNLPVSNVSPARAGISARRVKYSLYGATSTTDEPSLSFITKWHGTCIRPHLRRTKDVYDQCDHHYDRTRSMDSVHGAVHAREPRRPCDPGGNQERYRRSGGDRRPSL